MDFIDFQLDNQILKGIKEAGFVECTEVQTQTYALALKGKDVLVQSQTGSGKTAAFLIPLFSRLLQENGKALIVSPTRELAQQILEETRRLGKHLPFKSECFYGGTGYDKQQKALDKGLDIVIGTPGRLLDFNKSGKIPFDQFSIIVIDEADRLFDMGFYPDIQTILRKGCHPTKRQTMLFSATLNTRVRQLAWEFMNQPAEIEIEPETITVEEIDQVLFHVSSNEKFRLLLGLLKQEKPAQVLIFTNTKTQAFVLSQRLQSNGYKNLFLSGDLTQNKRSEALRKFKAGEIPVMIATDVAARGLHINDLPLVINYDIPEDFEVYVHRIGRTARAGKSGKAITLACEKYVFHLEAIENYINKKIPVQWFDDSLLAVDLHGNKPIKLPRSEKLHAQKESYEKRSKQKKSGTVSPAKAKTAKKPNKQSSLSDRMAYYAAKYEENFTNQKKSKKEKAKPTFSRSSNASAKKNFTANSSQQNRTKANRNRQKGKHTVTTQQKQHTATLLTKAEPKKQGFFAWLFQRKK